MNHIINYTDWADGSSSLRQHHQFAAIFAQISSLSLCVSLNITFSEHVLPGLRDSVSHPYKKFPQDPTFLLSPFLVAGFLKLAITANAEKD